MATLKEYNEHAQNKDCRYCAMRDICIKYNHCKELRLHLRLIDYDIDPLMREIAKECNFYVYHLDYKSACNGDFEYSPVEGGSKKLTGNYKEHDNPGFKTASDLIRELVDAHNIKDKDNPIKLTDIEANNDSPLDFDCKLPNPMNVSFKPFFDKYPNGTILSNIVDSVFLFEVSHGGESYYRIKPEKFIKKFPEENEPNTISNIKDRFKKAFDEAGIKIDIEEKPKPEPEPNKQRDLLGIAINSFFVIYPHGNIRIDNGNKRLLFTVNHGGDMKSYVIDSKKFLDKFTPI